ncbi:MAG: DEAD/DEAH box helicase [Balneola sp.]|nr:MAG: DEAD/DEAH box helicase [Balneola sp.]
MSFEEYGLSPELLSGLTDVQIDAPSPFQQQVLPAALDGKNLLVKSEAGDIVSFLIPTLKTLVENGEKEGTKVLILTPSIERAIAIDELIWATGYHAQISSALLAIKGNKEEQEQAVLDGAPVIVANPGRLIEILDKNNFHLKELQLIVIDEAHDMENFNLVNRVKDILRFVDGKPQTLVLSEQRNNATEELVKVTLQNPELIGFDIQEPSEKKGKANGAAPQKKEEAPENDSSEIDLEGAKKKLDEVSVKVVLKADQKEEEPAQEQPAEKPASAKKGKAGKQKLSAKEHGFINVPPRMKISTLMAHLEESTAQKVIVFSASKRTADRLFHILKKKNWGVVSVSGDLEKEIYTERYEKFVSGDMRVCVTGGMSVEDIEIHQAEEIINYDVPESVDEYSRRIELVKSGKTARIISLVSKMDKDDIARISDELGYAPFEIPLPLQVKEKKKGNKSGPKKRATGKKPAAQKNKAKKAPRKKVKPNELPRPTYEGLSGGRDGDSNSKGVFGWVKKLFN